MNEKLKKVIKPFRNKYLLTIIVFLVWMLFFDNHNLLDRGSYYHDIFILKQQKEYYLKKIQLDKTRLNELRTDASNLEKFAREQYLMKKDNEDIYLIDED
jgi:cell division protein DivIC